VVGVLAVAGSLVAVGVTTPSRQPDNTASSRSPPSSHLQ
jgi:hypothetical protein